MKPATGTTIITNGQLVDGNGARPIANATVIVKDGKITYAGNTAAAPVTPPNAQRIDARGGSIMPDLVEAHYHATYFNVADLPDLDTKYPAEYVTLRAAAKRRRAINLSQ
jgi:imidazolonepropionase-like amidohydrolase